MQAGPIAWGIKRSFSLVCDKLGEQIIADFGREESCGVGGDTRGIFL
jgi:hypothetical protein